MADNSRMSMYSLASAGGFRNVNAAQQSTQISTTSLLNALHNAYTSAQPYSLDASSSLVVNTWLTAINRDSEGRTGGTVDATIAVKAWEHARRRAEDGCILLGSLHKSTPSVLVPFIGTLPLQIPGTLFTALEVLRPFLYSVTPTNPSTPHHTALGVTFTLTLNGNITGATIAVAQGGIDTRKGLLKVPEQMGFRAFDVFYYLLTSVSTPAEREFLGLKSPSSYYLLSKSQTYDPPAYLPTADDDAAAADFRAALKAIGIKGEAHRNLISVLAGLLKLGDSIHYNMDGDEFDEICDEAAGVLGVEPEVLARKCSTDERETLIEGLYEALIDWVIIQANEAIASEFLNGGDSDSVSGGPGAGAPNTQDDNGDTVCITVLEIPDPTLGKAAAMRGVFDDTQGINAEMKEDGVTVVPAGSSVLREMGNAVNEVAADLGISTENVSREREQDRERREVILEKVGREVEQDGFFNKLLFPVEGQGINLGRTGRIDISTVLSSSRVWYHLSLHPTDEMPASIGTLPSTTSAWSAGTVSRQIREWRLPEWATRRNKNLDFTADFDIEEFCQRYAHLGCSDGRDGVESWIMERGWSNGEVVIGTERIWMRESAWWSAEQMHDLKPVGQSQDFGMHSTMDNTPYSNMSLGGSGFLGQDCLQPNSRDTLLPPEQTRGAPPSQGGPRSIAPTSRHVSAGDYGLGRKGDDTRGQVYYDDDIGGLVSNMDPELSEPKEIETRKVDKSRRIWVAFTWAMTFWIPSFVLRYVGRMKRPDVRMAWREKFVLFGGIFFMNCFILFFIIEFGKLLCPNSDKAYNAKEVAYHDGTYDFWVSIHGKVYDITKFYKINHGTTDRPVTSTEMLELAGTDVSEYFIAPLTLSCYPLVTDETIQLTANTSITDSAATHVSGPYLSNTDNSSHLHSIDWYTEYFLPRMKEYYKAELVVKRSNVYSDGEAGYNDWFILNNKIYDLTDYFYTIDEIQTTNTAYAFLDSDLTDLVKNYPGTDLTQKWNALYAAANTTQKNILLNNINCLNNAFYAGEPDFRNSFKCQVTNYILLAFTIILCGVILVKFLSALQFGSKRRPAQQDKFVICQVPAYTEGEDSLRKALDSLTALQYDNKRKLIVVICDGMIVGGGNDRPTPKIVLDVLGVDPKMDPPALPFKSVGVGSEQLNYGKVYSGLYEFEGNVVPYLVVVKIGKESEQNKSKPGNRGKRDSQILLMSFLNRVHHRTPMSPLELEMFHQINNIIGVNPEYYEYILMIDADTSVREDSLNRLVAACANDSKIIGICGETSLENEEQSWWTMIQVYEYYISHHLAKAFESLFGSVTCLPGCFSMYRLRTADKGKPLIISDVMVHEYSDGNVDTLHKKNLLSLGEDRFLTTLMMKNFPYHSFKFIPDAYASTAAPEDWSVLLSQRRRWINSTIHNLVELLFLKDMCGFCFFGMRLFVFVDLMGTLILPSTAGYIIYLIYNVSTDQGQFPLISIIMIAGTYGLQALIFLLKRKWQHIGWMIIYLLAFPIYNVALPVYSFWNQDNFSWGNTRVVIGEKGDKMIVAVDDEGFDPRSIPLQRWDDYAIANGLPGARLATEKCYDPYDDGYDAYDDGYHMDDMRSNYSSVKPASATGGFGGGRAPTISPYSIGGNRNTVYSDHPGARGYQSSMTLSADLHNNSQSPYRDNPPSPSLHPRSQSPFTQGRPSRSRNSSRMGLGFRGGSPSEAGSRPMSNVGMPSGMKGPSNEVIVDCIKGVLQQVDFEDVTKKQVRALVEQGLQTQLVGERRTFLDRMIDVELAEME